MSGSLLLVLSLLVALVQSGSASTDVEEMEQTDVLQQLLGRQERQRALASRQKLVGGAPTTGHPVRRAQLDNREMMTKQIMHAISEMMNSECMSDRDYQGWVDFGRRDAE
ncbi:cholecystokinin [Gouania willdenowi]|uniref:Cholecystokinin-like n=1 Tax=Gouania willdenowi TaxID=441366 RepID=A0A8C5EM46_GOUWI|nr:cholecystokinin-like [Gouania willdenowi]